MNTFQAGDVILVTGASSGIGRATALLCNQAGATVIASGRDAGALHALSDICAVPERLYAEPRDLCADLNSLPAWIQDLRRRYGKLRGMAFCAGQTWNLPMALYTPEVANQAFDICCHAPLMAGRGFCDRRNNTGRGAAVVFIAAAAALDPNPGQGIYGAAKAALTVGARCLAKEMAMRGIRVNCISPGLVQTPMMEDTVRQLGQDFLEREAPLYPLGFGQPDDVAQLAVFLLSDAARWLSGQNVPLTGGR